MLVKQCKLLTFLLLVIFLITLVAFHRPYPSEELLTSTTRKTRFAKVTTLSGFEDTLYERALDTHVQHSVRHGYPIYVARENAVDGIFNKIAYILDILLNELYKPADERVEWLL